MNIHFFWNGTPYRLVITTEGSYFRNVGNYFSSHMPEDVEMDGANRLPRWPLFLKMFCYRWGSSLISNSSTASFGCVRSRESYSARVAPFVWSHIYRSSPVSTTTSRRHQFVYRRAPLGWQGAHVAWYAALQKILSDYVTANHLQRVTVLWTED